MKLDTIGKVGTSRRSSISSSFDKIGFPEHSRFQKSPVRKVTHCMKLASLRSGRDGRLVVVSRDLGFYADASHIAPTMQAALDDWEAFRSNLEALAEGLDSSTAERHRFDAREVDAPLPRAFQWADGSAYVNHVELVRKARGAEMPQSFWTDPP